MFATRFPGLVLVDKTRQTGDVVTWRGFRESCGGQPVASSLKR